MKVFLFLTIGVILLQLYPGFGQQIKINRVMGNNINNPSSSSILAMAQDQQGYMWLSVLNKGLIRYDGSEIRSYSNDPGNPNSLGSNYIESLFVDEDNIFWIGLFGNGLDRYDPTTTTFTHFRHHPNDNSSLSNDTVTAILKDKQGILWIGTHGGLDQFNPKTNNFLHFRYKENDTSSISSNQVRVLYEDREGTIWIGTGSAFLTDGGGLEEGGLNRYDRTTGKFTRYRHDPNNPNSIASNKVRALFQDSKGNFWIGTAGDGLHTLDRATGLFTHYYYDPAHPEKLSRPPLDQASPLDHITFITEDATGSIWIGTFLQGINRYDPGTEKITHYGFLFQDNKIVSAKDTLSGYKNNQTWGAFLSKDSLLWICTLDGSLYKINTFTTTIPYYNINDLDANTFYHEPSGNLLWIGTDKGLVRRNLTDQNQKIELISHPNDNDLNDYAISAMKVNEEGKIWMATSKGLIKFDPLTSDLIRYVHNEKKIESLSSDNLNCLHIDPHKNIWIGTLGAGLDKMDSNTGTFIHYRNNKDNNNSLSSNFVLCLAEDKDNDLWIGTGNGLNVLNTSSGEFRHYLESSFINSIFIDATGIVWAGTIEKLYRFDRVIDQFNPYVDPNSGTQISDVVHIMEDEQKNLWISTTNSIVKVNENRDEVKQYGKEYGVHANNFLFANNFKGSNGQLFMGDQSGFYAFFPNQLKDNKPPHVVLTSFKLGDKEINPIEGGVLTMPVWKTKEIKLNYHQNIFSFEFTAIDFTSSGEKKYLFMLENYNNTWQNIGTDHKAYFFNVPPGSYIFRVKGINSLGLWDEKAISIIIIPPWWRTWWAYGIYGILFLAAIWATHRYQKTRTIRLEREKAQTRELEQAKEIEKAYTKLKATQIQLIQAEKMASLGELTAGIAHEIQNPLNFVNNFSEVSNELIDEMNEELNKGAIMEAKIIASDIKQNLDKILLHGKRADGIVKGMLQHSRSSSGVKEPTDINKLADEFLRLAYHGLRAKDKSFNTILKTDFDESIGTINIISQDMGRVILNLINNAFYAVTEKKKQQLNGYEPTVSVSTKKVDDKVLISVKDNGKGISPKVLDKIFQPFFTTKPTGQGTGLGLSMSYDIVKAHGGEIKVETKENMGSEFVISIPLNQ